MLLQIFLGEFSTASQVVAEDSDAHGAKETVPLPLAQEGAKPASFAGQSETSPTCR